MTAAEFLEFARDEVLRADGLSAPRATKNLSAYIGNAVHLLDVSGPSLQVFAAMEVAGLAYLQASTDIFFKGDPEAKSLRGIAFKAAVDSAIATARSAKPSAVAKALGA